MRLHKNLTDAVIEGLSFIFNENHYADKVVERQLKKDKRWGARDRAFIAETTYEIVRWKRLYAEIAEVKQPFSVQDLRRMFAVWAVLKGISLPNWSYFENTPQRRIKGKFDELSKVRKFRESIPDWLDNLGVEELGELFWNDEIHALNTLAPVVLRANTLKISAQQLKNVLEDEGVEANLLKNYPDALVLSERVNVFSTKAFSNGFFEVQDASSQKVAPFLQVVSGMRVVDTCAGAGGKTLHLASLMKNKGQIIAMDIYENKLQELKRRARRNEAFNIETKLIDSKQLKRMQNMADRVLIDAPCSGLGVLRRNPDAKWKLKPEFLEQIRKTQQEILQNYSKLVKSGGKLVYATCSILPSENQKQVEDFLKSEEGRGFVFEEEDKIFASQSGYDGFYMVRMRKDN
ncbi:RsmB/NOP family class I SAM-dependent RNA methyltransferase [Capnocytophaga cynodegmi]|uniref:rRNA (Cytosine-C(5)-)-methyltransferase rsmB n=1 Tax=Capnocytophaga cynodegmi TaxID=28189 RepID=A0A0B7HVD6_9FLAO|nr:methyltransferase domain-containing protein [Capnocytophaga cynodegmi]CEN35346.1 rRNA (Cytosine-C(5)-)-methyltransferase rsmB [Capnocytophaga cynodegmi]CEN41483.1 rRNA (Cytosine-C(5)-)-methyltransferase rsmB [Capnocytophaga cynodegmi]